MPRTFIIIALLSALPSCIDDSNRCAPGLLLERETFSCIMPPEGGVEAGAAAPAAEAGSDAMAAGNDAGDDELAEASGEDASEAGAESGDGTGIGTPCNGNEDCSALVADFCLIDVTKQGSPGTCTITPCEPGGCGAGYLCCDCSKVAAYFTIFPEGWGCLLEAERARFDAYCSCP